MIWENSMQRLNAGHGDIVAIAFMSKARKENMLRWADIWNSSLWHHNNSFLDARRVDFGLWILALFFAPKLQFRDDITQLSFKHIAFFRQWLVRCRNTSEGFLGLVCLSNSAQSFSVSFTWSNSISSVMSCCLKTTPGVRCTLLFGATVVQTYPDVTRLLPCCNSTIYSTCLGCLISTSRSVFLDVCGNDRLTHYRGHRQRCRIGTKQRSIDNFEPSTVQCQIFFAQLNASFIICLHICEHSKVICVCTNIDGSRHTMAFKTVPHLHRDAGAETMATRMFVLK